METANKFAKVTILQVKRVAGKVTVKYQAETAHGPDTYTLETKDDPHPDFLEAFQALADIGRGLCHIQKKKGCSVSTRGVSVHQKDEGVGYIITLYRKLPEGDGHTINTPLRYDQHRNRKVVLESAHVKALEEVVHEAKAFLGGKRLQGDMFEGGG